MVDEIAAKPKPWKKATLLLSAFTAILLIHVGLKIAEQEKCEAIVEDLAGSDYKTAQQEAVARGETAMPYLSRAFYYDLDPKVRIRAGEAVLASLEELEKQAPTREEERAEWQEHMRVVAESDMTSKALRDEKPEVRKIAAEITRIIGFEHEIEEGRFERWQNMDKLIHKLRQVATAMAQEITRLRAEAEKKLDEPGADEAQVQSELRRDIAEVIDPIMQEWHVDHVVGEFGNSVLVGIIADAPSPAMRTVATEMLLEMLAAAYRADDREEMIKLVGHRRLRILLDLLAQDVPHVEALLSFSPHINRHPKLLPGIQQKLQEAKAEGPEEYAEGLSFWKDRYSDIEEGSKGALRTKAVAALIEESSS